MAKRNIVFYSVNTLFYDNGTCERVSRPLEFEFTEPKRWTYRGNLIWIASEGKFTGKVHVEPAGEYVQEAFARYMSKLTLE